MFCYTFLEARLNGRLNDEGEDHHVLVVGALLHRLNLLVLEALLGLLVLLVTFYEKPTINI